MPTGFGIRARLISVAAASTFWLVFLLGAYFVIFFGPRYAHWIYLAMVFSLAWWGTSKFASVSVWLKGLDAAPYPVALGWRAEIIKFTLRALFFAYCASAFLVPGPPEVRVALGAFLAIVPGSAEILLPTPKQALPAGINSSRSQQLLPSHLRRFGLAVLVGEKIDLDWTKAN